MSRSLYPEIPTTSDEIPTQLAAMATLGSSTFRSPIKEDKPVTIKLDNIKQLTSVRYGASWAPKDAGPWPNSPPRPAERPGAGPVFLEFPAPAPGPSRSPDGSPLKQVGRNRAPSRE